MTWLLGYSIFAVSDMIPELVYEKFHKSLKLQRNDFFWKDSDYIPETSSKIYFNSEAMYNFWDENLFVLNDDQEGAFVIAYRFFDEVDLQIRAVKLIYENNLIPYSRAETPYYYVFPKKIYEYELILPAPVEDNDFSNQISKIFLKIFEDE